uniref:CCHC-type domain-containing protein n=1 Tax=Timema poppense TaxID=170557 RepID=A0A7R9D0V5_TIMPO|nr:unnamed protein product [Timema poppensis]
MSPNRNIFEDFFDLAKRNKYRLGDVLVQQAIEHSLQLKLMSGLISIVSGASTGTPSWEHVIKKDEDETLFTTKMSPIPVALQTRSLTRHVNKRRIDFHSTLKDEYIDLETSYASSIGGGYEADTESGCGDSTGSTICWQTVVLACDQPPRRYKTSWEPICCFTCGARNHLAVQCRG